MILKKIFKVEKPVIGMLHLDHLLGQRKFKSIDYVIKKASKDIKALETGGIDGILIENWQEDSVGSNVSAESAVSFSIITNELAKKIKIPFGINVLNNDCKIALSIAKLTNASFIELDVFVDHVRSNFSHSPKASKTPFEIHPNPQEIVSFAKKVGLPNFPLFVFIQPKHYIMLEKGKSIEESAQQAQSSGAAAVLLTKETSVAPSLSVLAKAKKAVNIPVGIGSGFNADNAWEYLKVADFAIVGTSIKFDNKTDNPVDIKKVKALIKVIKNYRNKS